MRGVREASTQGNKKRKDGNKETKNKGNKEGKADGRMEGRREILIGAISHCKMKSLGSTVVRASMMKYTGTSSSPAFTYDNGASTEDARAGLVHVTSESPG